MREQLGLLTQIDLHRNVRPMLRAAFDPKRWVLAAIALAFAHDVSFAQAPSPPATPPAPAPTAQTPPASPAPAPAATAEPTAAAKEAARAAYTRGQAAFAAGQYDVARSAFEEAFAAVPNPIVLLSVSESHAKLGHVREAAAALHRYLQLRPDAPDRADIEAKLKGLENTPAFVAVKSVPPGAQLIIDDSPTAQTAPAQLELTPGKHTLKYSLPGYTSSSELLVVDPGARYDLEIVLQPAPAPEAPPPAPAESTALPPPAAEPVSPAALWITGGLGAAGIITGTVLGFLALKAKSDFDSNPTEAQADSGERLALFADVGFGIGIMALATTAVLLFTNDAPATKPADAPSDKASARAAPKASLEITPQLSPTTASATARIRF